MKVLRNPLFYVSVLLAGALVFQVAQFVQGQTTGIWQPPTASPPGGQPEAPLDVGTGQQLKKGNLGAGLKDNNNIRIDSASGRLLFDRTGEAAGTKGAISLRGIDTNGDTLTDEWKLQATHNTLDPNGWFTLGTGGPGEGILSTEGDIITLGTTGSITGWGTIGLGGVSLGAGDIKGNSGGTINIFQTGNIAISSDKSIILSANEGVQIGSSRGNTPLTLNGNLNVAGYDRYETVTIPQETIYRHYYTEVYDLLGYGDALTGTITPLIRNRKIEIRGAAKIEDYAGGEGIPGNFRGYVKELNEPDYFDLSKWIDAFGKIYLSAFGNVTNKEKLQSTRLKEGYWREYGPYSDKNAVIEEASVSEMQATRNVWVGQNANSLSLPEYTFDLVIFPVIRKIEQDGKTYTIGRNALIAGVAGGSFTAGAAVASEAVRNTIISALTGAAGAAGGVVVQAVPVVGAFAYPLLQEYKKWRDANKTATFTVDFYTGMRVWKLNTEEIKKGGGTQQVLTSSFGGNITARNLNLISGITAGNAQIGGNVNIGGGLTVRGGTASLTKGVYITGGDLVVQQPNKIMLRPPTGATADITTYQIIGGWFSEEMGGVGGKSQIQCTGKWGAANEDNGDNPECTCQYGTQRPAANIIKHSGDQASVICTYP
ncbi:MAG: hypothetical protein Q8P01_02045 [bacterium]|nr:hypothetical protein [bacterium]MDP2703982.1 hypothetical protein [bacterium]